MQNLSVSLNVPSVNLRVTGRGDKLKRPSRQAESKRIFRANFKDQKCNTTNLVHASVKDSQVSSKSFDHTDSRRSILLGTAALVGTLTSSAVAAPSGPGPTFTTTPSGLKYFDAKEGTGKEPVSGDTVVVHWSGYTSGYQGKRIENTSVRDEPFVFTLGTNKVFPAFEEAVLGMKVGGLRRIEIPGDHPEISYPRPRNERFTDIGLTYRYGPQPSELGGQRALDFVLDNPTLQDFNRTLVYDIRLLNIRGSK